MRWNFGKLKWACMIELGDDVLYRGHFSVGVGVIRYQNIDLISDIRDFNELKQCVICSLADSVAQGLVAPIDQESFFEKEVNGRNWLIGRTLNALNYPEYHALSPIDHRTAINVPATLDNCWDRDEIIPWEVEQKHLASFWDFLSQIQFIENREDALAPGSHLREAPGQAEKIPNDDFEW